MLLKEKKLSILMHSRKKLNKDKIDCKERYRKFSKEESTSGTD